MIGPDVPLERIMLHPGWLDTAVELLATKAENMPTRITPMYRVAMLNARSNAQGSSLRRALKLIHVSRKDSLDGTLKLQ